MQPLIPKLFLLVISLPAVAESGLILNLEMGGHFGNQFTKVFQGNSGWHCETELTRMFPLPDRPKALDAFPASRKPASTAGCRDTLRAKIRREGKIESWEGCADDPAAREFLQELSGECGRH